MVEEKVFVVDMRESIARGIWMNPEQGEKIEDRTQATDWTRS